MLRGSARRAWTSNDLLVSAASIVFAHGGPPALTRNLPRVLQLCPNVILGDETLLHRCDGQPLVVSMKSVDVVRELLRGHDSIRSLTAACGGRFSEEELAAFVSNLRAFALFHSGIESPDDRARRAESMLKWSVAEVPFYARHPSRLDLAPFIDARAVRRDWDAFTRRGAEELIGSAKTEQLFSSGSTSGTSLRSVVEREVADLRRGYDNSVTRGLHFVRSGFHLSRPESFGLPWRGGVSLRRYRGRYRRWMAVTPGPDPSAVKDAAWDRVIELLIRKDPDCIAADPAYLAGLARRCLVHGVGLRGLSQVIVGHAFCWRIYSEPIERAFGQAPRSAVGTSEFGIICATCSENRLHLLETNFLFEILAKGRRVREGQVGALVATTLDTRLRPLIRYVNGDVVQLVSSECRCGRPYRVVEYEGRIAHLLEDRQGLPVTYRDIDEIIGAPPGLQHFKLRETGTSFVLELVASCHEILRTSALRDRLQERLGRRVAVRFLDSFGIERGKHVAVATRDRYAAWLGHFLGNRPRV
jgi:phenylacetate-coenzyme A ligase PaaK-like adenylate-forming protein